MCNHLTDFAFSGGMADQLALFGSEMNDVVKKSNIGFVTEADSILKFEF